MKKFLHSISLLGLVALAAPSAFANADAKLVKIGDVYCQANQPFTFYAQLSSVGDAEVTSVTYTAQISGSEEVNTYTMELATPLAAGESRYVQWQAVGPDVAAGKAKTISFKITGVNGETVSKVAVKATAHVEDFVPFHRSMIEDYTGAWCGYCPRGFVTLEAVNRDFPGQILNIAFHNGDAMDVSTMAEPVQVSGYPTLLLNRATLSDFANAGGLALYKSNKLADAAVDMVSAEWLDEDHSSAKGVVTLEFGEDVDAGDYTVDFFLIEDGLQSSATGQSSYWDQVDYYYGSSYPWDDPLWDQFLSNEENHYSKTSGGYTYDYIKNLTFNDVCIANATASSSYNASLPAASARTPFTVEYTFEGVDKIKEYGSSKKFILQNPDQCRIAVVVCDGDDVVNCDWLTISEAAGVNSVNADEAVSNLNAPVEYFNLQGQRVANPEAGQLLIKRQGSKATKVVIR
jgi:thiol-disulfide isomerase/thioredoxin